MTTDRLFSELILWERVFADDWDDESVHADRQVSSMILEHAEGQDDRPVLVNGPFDMGRSHEFIAHGESGFHFAFYGIC